MAQATQASTHPPMEYAVAIWLGMPDEEVSRGLREGWIRRPAGLAPDDSDDPVVGGPRDQDAVSPSTLRSWLARLDPSLGDDGVDALWQEAGADEASRTGTLLRFVAGALGLDAAQPVRSRIEAALESLDGDTRIVRLDDRSADELAALARTDGGVRRALATHSRWALSGTGSDPGHRFDRYDANSGEQLLSEAWMNDRARHAVARRGEGAAAEGDGWRYVDRAQGDAADVTVGGTSSVVHQVVFARDDGDSVTGGATTDRVHGGRGDDRLRGRAGDDLLEGADGDDVLSGGTGSDVLAGGRGHDALDGGNGDDRLEGGSGDDELDGGRGDDRLQGGRGDDVYAFESGDGLDVIEDDGGSLLIDDAEVRGMMRRDGTFWRSEDGRLAFAVVQGEDGPTLRIASHDGGNRIEVRGWRQGAFGITLEGVDHEDEGNDDSLDEPGDPGPVGDASWLDPLPPSALVDAAAWVDGPGLDAALRAWLLSPADKVAMPAPDPTAPTAADVADALTQAASDDDAAEGLVASAWPSDAPAAWFPDALAGQVPPALTLQRTR